MVIEDPHVQVTEPAKEAPSENDAPKAHDFLHKRKSMDINEFRRPSLAEIEQEALDDSGDEDLVHRGDSPTRDFSV